MKQIYRIRLFISIIIFIFAILGICGIFYPVKIFDIQLAPLIQKNIADFSVVSAILISLIILITLFFGRLYCSVICPFGIFQEIIFLVLNRFHINKQKYIKNYSLKYFILAVVLGTLISGSAFLIRFIEPYTYFGLIFTFSIFGICILVFIFLLVFFKNRFFCTNICPIGALLGLISKISINKINIDEDMCVSCGMCEKNCPSGCINSKEKNVDNETCIKCFKCLDVCPKGGINYIRKQNKIKFSFKRRKIILSVFVIGLFASMVKAGMIAKEKIVHKFKEIILPPGAKSQEEFLNKCFNCNLCVTNCPNKIISKSNKNFSAVHIDYKNGFCDSNCNKCSQICPSGAIKKLSLKEKQKIRIAMASINYEKCSNCGTCVEICPYGAIIKNKDDKPYIDAIKCIGCNKCKVFCKFDAINIFAVRKQSII